MTGEPERILLVEDDDMDGESYQTTLKQAFPGMVVDWARGLDTAQEYLRTHVYAAVVSDQKFPDNAADADEEGMDKPNGTKLIKAIRAGQFDAEDRPNSKAVIVLQSSAAAADIQKWGKSAGADLAASKDDFEEATVPYLQEQLRERAAPTTMATVQPPPPEVGKFPSH